MKGSIPKIADSGFIPEGHIPKRNAPEVFEKGHFSAASDVYSLGILLWEMWYGEDGIEVTASSGEEGSQAPSKSGPIFKPQMPSQKIRDLISICWDQNINTRLSSKDLLKSFALLHSS